MSDSISQKLNRMRHELDRLLNEQKPATNTGDLRNRRIDEIPLGLMVRERMHTDQERMVTMKDQSGVYVGAWQRLDAFHGNWELLDGSTLQVRDTREVKEPELNLGTCDAPPEPKKVALRGADFRDIRLQLKLTQKEIGDRIGWSDASVSKMERGGLDEEQWKLLYVKERLDEMRRGV